MVTSFWSKIYAVTRWTNCESLGKHPMWMFYICLVQWCSQVTGIGQTPAECDHGALARHVPSQAQPSLRYWFIIMS